MFVLSGNAIVSVRKGDTYAKSHSRHGLSGLFFAVPPVADLGSATGDTIRYEKQSSQQLAGLRIMVVEDEEDARLFLQRFLDTQGASVETTEDGRQCLARLHSAPEAFDMVISDIGMPVMDGIELVRIIRESKIDSVNSMVCIALTAYAYATDRVKALKAGFDSYVPKPVDADELLSIIEMQMSIKRKQAPRQGH